MLNTVPDVMLCDIEMPEETGLEPFKGQEAGLCHPVHLFNSPRQVQLCAGSHAHLGAFDYIQPAPYSEISQVTARAVGKMCRPAATRTS